MALTTSAQQILRDARVDGDEAVPEPFWQIIERYRGELVNQAYAIIGSRADAEDAVQETFCEVFKRRDKLERVRSLGAWMRAINRTNALDHRRVSQRHVEKADRKKDEMPRHGAITGGFSGLEAGESLARHIEKLPPKMRAVAALRFYEQLSYEEVSLRLEIPLSTVYRLFFKASKQLFAEMKEQIPTQADDAREDSNE